MHAHVTASACALATLRLTPRPPYIRRVSLESYHLSLLVVIIIVVVVDIMPVSVPVPVPHPRGSVLLGSSVVNDSMILQRDNWFGQILREAPHHQPTYQPLYFSNQTLQSRSS